MSMIDERVLVGHNDLAELGLAFEVVKTIEITPDPEDPGWEQTDYVVRLYRINRPGIQVIWCQGYDDLDYDYFNEYKGCVT